MCKITILSSHALFGGKTGLPNGQKWSEFEIFFYKNVLKLNFNVSPLYEKNLHFAPFGLYSKRAPRGPSKGGGPEQNFLQHCFFA